MTQPNQVGNSEVPPSLDFEAVMVHAHDANEISIAVAELQSATLHLEGVHKPTDELRQRITDLEFARGEEMRQLNRRFRPLLLQSVAFSAVGSLGWTLRTYHPRS